MRSHTRPGRRWGRFVAPLALAIVLVATAGCAGPADNGGGTNDSDTGTDELTLGITGLPASLAPGQLDEGDPAFIWTAVYDNLLILDNDGVIQPNAAESWEYSEDLKTLTLKIREGMTFSTGEPVDASAVAATLEYVRTTPGRQQARVAVIDSIEATDDTTVVITLSQPDAELLINLTGDAGVIADPATLEDPKTALRPVASGPYEFDDATSDGVTWVLNKREDYWNADAYPFEKLTIRAIADRAAGTNALLAGELDAGIAESPAVVDQLKDQGFTVTHVDASLVGSLIFLDRTGAVLKPLGDVRVRQAINMAFDREAWAEQVFQGAGVPTEQLFNPKGMAYDPDLEGTYPYDVDGAKKLLADAGYPDGFTATMPSSFISQAFEPQLTQALKDIGITVQWEPVPPQDVVSSLSSGKYGMVFFFDGLSLAPRELQNNFGVDGFLNPLHYTDDTLTQLMGEVDFAATDEASADLYQQINAHIVEEALDSPIAYLGTDWVTRDGIEYLGNGSSTLSTVRQFGLSK